MAGGGLVDSDGAVQDFSDSRPCVGILDPPDGWCETTQLCARSRCPRGVIKEDDLLVAGDNADDVAVAELLFSVLPQPF